MMQATAPISAEAAYGRCLAITRREAKNFYYGIRLLETRKRHAMAALYALARRIDDISDGHAKPEQKLTQLAALRTKLAGLAEARETAGNDLAEARETADNGLSEARETAGNGLSEARAAAGNGLSADPVLRAVAYAAAEFPIPVSAFVEIIEGCEQDINGYSYQTIADTVRYCRLVAGSVGRLSLGVFGCDNFELCTLLADDLGVALQLTNILRDIREDAEMGRVYLPAEDIARFDCAADLSGPRKNVARLVRFEAERAEEWFERGFELLWHLDRRSKACVSAMSGIYFRLLHHIKKQPEIVVDKRMSLPVWEKSYVAAKSLVGFRP